MNIAHLVYKIKSLRVKSDSSEVMNLDEEGRVQRHTLLDKFFLSLVIILLSTLAFGLGRLTAGENRGEMRLTIDPTLLSAPNTSSGVSSADPLANMANLKASGAITASSKGTKYYFPNCKNTISAKNKVTFATAALAEAAGYTLASNCLPK